MSTYDLTNLDGESNLPVVVVDIDSTIADTRGRRHLAPPRELHGDPEQWKPYSLGCGTDEPIAGLVRLLKLLHSGNLVFLLSARNDVAEALTVTWLRIHGVPYDRLRLWGDEDAGSTPSTYKVRAINAWIAEGWNVQLFIDDWAETCQIVTDLTGVPSVSPAFLAGDYKPGH